MTQAILSHQFENGLTLVCEQMDWLQSAAFTIVVPGGCARDPDGKHGLANFVCDMVQRGCGQRDSRQFINDLDNLGVERGASISSVHAQYGGAVPAERLYDVLSIYADLVQRPHLPEDQIDEGRMVCFQEIRALEDDLAQRAMNELRERQFPAPFGRNCHGSFESVSQITIEDIRDYVDRTYRPNESILAIAGNVDWPQIRDQVGELFGKWQFRELPQIQTQPARGGHHHITHDSNQTQICVSLPSVPYRHEDYFQARGAVGVLSGGMSSRLFTEVREERGLCYHVSATIEILRDEGCVVCYAGSERPQETLDVLIAELLKLKDGIKPDELERLKVQVRSGLIMQQESSRSRAASIAGDWYHLGKVRTLDEVNKLVNELTVGSINDYLAANPPTDFCIVTLGKEELEMPSGVS